MSTRNADRVQVLLSLGCCAMESSARTGCLACGGLYLARPSTDQVLGQSEGFDSY